MEAGGGGEGSRGLQGDRSETVWRRVGEGKGGEPGSTGRPIRDFEEAGEVYLGGG